MPQYQYVAKSKNINQTLTGIIDSQTIEEAGKILHEKNLIILSIKPQRPRAFLKRNPFAFQIVKLEDLVLFFRELATLIDSGVNLVSALEILKEQIENPLFKNIISSVYNEIQSGKNFCDSIAKYPKVFSEFYVNLIRSGEAAGMLDDVLERLATYLEKMQSIRRKVIASLVYPAVVVAMAFVITAVLLIKVVPVFKNIFDTLGGALPLPTQILISVSQAVQRYFILMAAGLVLLVVFLKKYISTPAGRYKLDRLILKIPVFGALALKYSVAKFSRTFSALVKSGVPILNSIEIVAKTSGNKVIEAALLKSIDAIRQGEPLYQRMEKSGVFPVMVVRMIGVGEKSGELEKMLSKIALFYEEQVDNAVSSMASIIEPVIIAFLGVVIGAIVLALFLPIFKISELIAR